MQIGKVGMYQVVVARSNGYRDGDLIVFAPVRAILPEDLRGEYTNADTGKSYLVGADHDRVGQVKLRGVLSEGVTLPPEYVTAKLGVRSLDELTPGEDLAPRLGITQVRAARADEHGRAGARHGVRRPAPHPRRRAVRDLSRRLHRG
ncbi:MAG: hypothetical protein R3A52_27920 [Polyangiales bacterium]